MSIQSTTQAWEPTEQQLTDLFSNMESGSFRELLASNPLKALADIGWDITNEAILDIKKFISEIKFDVSTEYSATAFTSNCNVNHTQKEK